MAEFNHDVFGRRAKTHEDRGGDWRAAGGEDPREDTPLIDGTIEQKLRKESDAEKAEKRKQVGKQVLAGVGGFGAALALSFLLKYGSVENNAPMNMAETPTMDASSASTVSSEGLETAKDAQDMSDAESIETEAALLKSFNQDIVSDLGLGDKFSSFAFNPAYQELIERNGDGLIPSDIDMIFDGERAEGCYLDEDKNNEFSVANAPDVYRFLYGTEMSEASPEQRKGAMIYVAERQASIAAKTLMDNKYGEFAEVKDVNEAIDLLMELTENNPQKKTELAMAVANIIAGTETGGVVGSSVDFVSLSGLEYRNSGQDAIKHLLEAANVQVGTETDKGVKVSTQYLQGDHMYTADSYYLANCLNPLFMEIHDEKTGVEWIMVYDEETQEFVDVTPDTPPEETDDDDSDPTPPGPGPHEDDPVPPGPHEDDDDPDPEPEHKKPVTVYEGVDNILGAPEGKPETAYNPDTGDFEHGAAEVHTIVTGENDVTGNQIVGANPEASDSEAIENGSKEYRPAGDGVVESEKTAAERAEAEAKQEAADEAFEAILNEYEGETGAVEDAVGAAEEKMNDYDPNAEVPAANPDDASEAQRAAMEALMNSGGGGGTTDTTQTGEPQAENGGN